MGLFKKPAAKAASSDASPTALPAIVTVIAANLAVRVGQKLVRRGVEQGLLKGEPVQTGRVIRGNTIAETVIGTMLAEVARRSVPGAILVGGGLIAKLLRDRKLGRSAETTLSDQNLPPKQN